VLQTAASYPAGYGPIKPLVIISPQFVLNDVSLLLKLQSTMKGQNLRISKMFIKTAVSPEDVP